MANPCSRRCSSLSTECTMPPERCHCCHFWNVSLPPASGLCGGTPLPRVHVWWHDEDQDVALQHQTTQRSPAEEHFGDACESPRWKTKSHSHTFLKTSPVCDFILAGSPDAWPAGQKYHQMWAVQLYTQLPPCKRVWISVSHWNDSTSFAGPELILLFCPCPSLKLCVILEPMQELMSRHKTYSLSPRDCLKTCLFQKWQRMVAPPGLALDINPTFFNTQGVPKHLTAFRRPVISAILVKITSDFHRMYRNGSRFYI